MRHLIRLFIFVIITSGSYLNVYAQVFWDDASQLPYTDGWQNGDNGGEGYRAWSIFGTGANGGNIRANATNTDCKVLTGGYAFGIWAQNGTTFNVVRPFLNTLLNNQSLAFDWNNTTISNPGQAGFSLLNNDNDTLFEYYFTGGSTFYYTNDNANEVATTMPWTNNIQAVNFTVINAATGMYRFTVKANGTSYERIGMLKNPVNGKQVKKISFFTYKNAAGGENMYFNNLRIITPPGNALAFDGNADYVTAGTSLTSSNTFTIEAWIKPNDIAGYKDIVSYSQIASSGDVLEFRLRNDTLELGISKTDWYVVSGTTTIQSGLWQHVAVVKNNSNVQLYINGIAAGSETISSPVMTLEKLNIGRRNRLGGSDYYFNGLIDEVKIWNTARTATDILNEMDAELTGTESGLMAYYKFDLGNAGGANANLTALINETRTNHGTLSGFSLANLNTTSNFVTSAAVLAPLSSQTISFGALSAKTYGDSDYTITATGGGSGNPVIFTSSDPTIASCTGTNGSTIKVLKAGTCKIYANQSGNSSYYAAPQVEQMLTINKKTITVTADAKFKIYGDPDPALTYTYTPELVTGDSFTGALAKIAEGECGNCAYAIMQGTLSLGDNYTIVYYSDDLMMAKRNLTIGSLSAENKEYDGTITATLSANAFLENVATKDIGKLSIIYPTTVTFDNASAGTNKAVTHSGFGISGGVSGNYTLTQPTGLKANITKKDLLLGTDNIHLDKTYDGTTIATIIGTATLDGIVSGDENKITLVYPEPGGTFIDKNAGNDKIVTLGLFTIEGLAKGNYTLVQNTDWIDDIYPKELTISGVVINDKTYDGNVIATLNGTPLLAGVLTGEESDVALNMPSSIEFADQNVGNNINVSLTNFTLSGAESDNYTLTQPSGIKGNITAKPITVTADDDQSKVYGETDPPFTYTVSPALVNGDVFTGMPGRDAGENVDLYSIHQGSLSAGNNYSITFNSSNFSIEPKELVVTGATVATKVYDGNTDAVITGADLSGKVGTDDVTLANATTGTFATANAGSEINVTANMTITGPAASNYSLIQPILKGSIDAANLTARADDKTREQGDANPEFTITYTGFVNSETDAVLDSKPVANCAANESSPAGDYDIVVSGGVDNNYEFINVNGKLTITASTGINKVDASGYTIYPNPSSDFISIKTPQAGNTTIRIFDGSGHLVMDAHIENEQVNIQKLTPGVYTLKIDNYTFKLVKQ